MFPRSSEKNNKNTKLPIIFSRAKRRFMDIVQCENGNSDDEQYVLSFLKKFQNRFISTDAWCDPDTGATPLMLALQHGKTKVADAIFYHGKIDFSAVDYAGDTILVYAARFRNVGMVRLILNFSCIGSNSGGSVIHKSRPKALMMASNHHDEESVALLSGRDSRVGRSGRDLTYYKSAADLSSDHWYKKLDESLEDEVDIHPPCDSSDDELPPPYQMASSKL